VTARSISQVQPNGQCGLFENLASVFHHSAILSHKPVSFPLRLERVNRWEHIASRRRPAFSSHLRNGVHGNWKYGKFHMTIRRLGTTERLSFGILLTTSV